MGEKAEVASPVMMMAVSTGGNAQTVAPKKTSAAASKTKKPRAKSSHPKTAEMVNAAIVALQERGGSSLRAIKKHIEVAYKLDAEKQSVFIKRYLRAAVTSGDLIQTKGNGAAGSFKLPAKATAANPKAKSAALKVARKSAKKSAVVKNAPVARKAPAKRTKAVAVKRRSVKGPVAKPSRPRTTKAKIVAKSPAKKATPTKKAAKRAPTKPKKVRIWVERRKSGPKRK